MAAFSAIISHFFLLSAASNLYSRFTGNMHFLAHFDSRIAPR